jgi:hypothetical protein
MSSFNKIYIDKPIGTVDDTFYSTGCALNKNSKY